MPVVATPVDPDGDGRDAAVRSLLDRGFETGGGPPTRTDWAYQLLRSKILTGELAPSERLKIKDLVTRYPDLSPTPAREALARLAELGLVELTPRRGVRVAPWSRAELIDLNRTRLLLEEQAARASLANVDDDWRRELADAFAEVEQQSEAAAAAEFPLSAAELVAWEKVHRRFHLLLLARCESQWLLRLIDILFENSMRYRFVTLREDPDSFSRSLGGHRRLLEFAQSGDVERLVTEMRAHAMLALDADGPA